MSIAKLQKERIEDLIHQLKTGLNDEQQNILRQLIDMLASYHYVRGQNDKIEEVNDYFDDGGR